MRVALVAILLGALQALPQCVAKPVAKGVWTVECKQEPGVIRYLVVPSSDQWAEMTKPDTTKVKK